MSVLNRLVYVQYCTICSIVVDQSRSSRRTAGVVFMVVGISKGDQMNEASISHPNLTNSVVLAQHEPNYTTTVVSPINRVILLRVLLDGLGLRIVVVLALRRAMPPPPPPPIHAARTYRTVLLLLYCM